MAPLADFLLASLPLKSLGVPYELTHYVPGKTPLSTPQQVFPTLAAYLVIIFGIQAWMKNKPPYRLQFLFRFHNAFLTIGSLLLVLLIMEEVVPAVYEHGVFWGLCNVNMWSEVRDALSISRLDASSRLLQRLEFYYMINYYFKYIELVDTMFLALKKKPLGTRHVEMSIWHVLTAL